MSSGTCKVKGLSVCVTARNDTTLLLGEEETEEEFAAVVLDLLMLLLQNSASNIGMCSRATKLPCGGFSFA